VTKQDDGKCSLSEGHRGARGPLEGNTNRTLWHLTTIFSSKQKS